MKEERFEQADQELDKNLINSIIRAIDLLYLYSKEEKENLSRLIIELNRYNQLHNNPEERIKLVYKAGEK